MDLREIGWGDMYWTNVAQYRDRRRAFLSTAINFRVP
jgi:hypothetical protein